MRKSSSGSRGGGIVPIAVEKSGGGKDRELVGSR
jgi:hypothetical protein